MDDLARLGDEELLRAYAASGRPALARLALSVGSLLMLGGCLLPPLLVWTQRARSHWLLLGPLLALATCWLALALWRASPWQAEIFARFFPELAPALEAAARRVAAPDGPAWVALFRGRVLPHGGTRWVRVELSPPAQGRVEVAALAYRWDEDPVQRAVRGEGALDPEQAGALLRQVEALGPGEALRLGANPVRDGLPCDLALVGRAGRRLVSGNLAALGADEQAGPAGALARALLELSAQRLGARGIMGSCDAHGDVTLEEV